MIKSLLKCVIDYNGDVNAQLYKLFGIDDRNQQHIQDIF